MPAQKTYDRYTVTSALIYANGPVHIGHLAGCLLPADIYARYLRLRGREVCFVGGTDEHGVPITIQAQRESSSPQQIVDTYHHQIKDSLEALGISFDAFDRTTAVAHHELSSEFFLSLYSKQYFVREETQQYYDVDANRFLTDRYICGSCPSCGYDSAYGDQCEGCGRTLSPDELQLPRSIFGGRIERRNTENWHLPLERWQKQLEDYIKGQTHWRKSVYAQCQSWLKEGLRSRAMTRDLDWGIPVPLPGLVNKVLYVWFEAPIGYITATKSHLPHDWEKYWKDPATRLVHFVGKDNIVFHCLIFPLTLMLKGDYILPSDVPANEFLNLEGEKISTSKGWAIWLHEYLSDFPAQEDALRYALSALMPETKDSNFTWKSFQAYNNNELVHILGNFIHRVLHLSRQYAQGKVPDRAALSVEDREALQRARAQVAHLAEAIEEFRFREALASMMEIARIGNKYLAVQAPWESSTSSTRRESQIYTSLQIAAILSVVCEPFLPFTAEKIRHLLNLASQPWSAYETEMLPTGHRLRDPVPLFSKIEDSVIDHQLNKLQQKMKPEDTSFTFSVTPSPKTTEISFETFAQIDMRVGTVLRCESVPKSEKLLRFTIDDGEGERVILSGIAPYYKPEALIGTQIVFVKNLKPRKIMGELSEGMILSASLDSSLRLLQPDEIIHPGAQVS